MEPYVRKIINAWRKHKSDMHSSTPFLGQRLQSFQNFRKANKTRGGVKKIFGLRASYEMDESDSDNSSSEREKRILSLASESYQTMLENSKLGDVLIAERCYVLLGTRPSDHSLLFSALQELIEHEDQVSYHLQNRYMILTTYR